MAAERILIVEDEGIAAVSLEAMITDLGYLSVGIAFSADEALEKALSARPDLILMDIKLQGKRDGIDSADEIHKSFDVPIIFITAYSDRETLERAKVSAPFGYLMKPYRVESVRTTIEIALNLFQLGKKLRERERDFRTLFDLSPVGTLLISKDQVIRRANVAFAHLVGLDPAENLEGRKLADFFVEDETTSRLLTLSPVSGNRTKTGEARARRKDGTHIWLRLQSALIHEMHPEGTIGLFIVSDISAQKEVESHLKEKADVLLESNQRLQDFTAIASHDLTAPARISGMYVGLLARDYGDKLDERGREFLGFAISESKKMQELIRDLVEYTKTCRFPLEMKPTSLNKVVRDTLVLLGPEIEEKKADVSYADLPTIMGSESQLRRLFWNLISNAIKFTHSQPKIEISASESKTDHTISVSDNGVGIIDGERDLIFEMFRRGHSQSEFPGTGIGLASCKKIIENHNGKIWIESADGKGSTFFVAFPIHLNEK